jgi:hypothetical protein
MPLYNNPDFQRLPAGLAVVFETQSQRSFFALTQWYDLLVRFGLPQGTGIRMYADERPGSTIALLLTADVLGGRRCLTSLANFYSVEHGLSCSQGADLGCGLAAILAEIEEDRPRWDCLRLIELDPCDAGYGALVRALRQAGFLVECAPGAATWFETTEGMTFADYVAERPSQLRNTWRRKRRSAAIDGRLTAAFYSDNAGIDTAIADYQKIYAASWKTAEAFPQFIPALIRLAAELKALRLGIYYVDGVPAAAQFWILWRRRAVIYKLAHDRRFDRLSLGTVLTMEMIERVLDQDRPSEINLGRGDDPYKQLWLPRRRERWGITAANPRTMRGLRLGLEREAAKLYHRLRGEPLVPPPTTIS